MIHLSVIIATTRQPTMVRACLQALCHQTQPASDFEVILVVDEPADRLSALLAGLSCPYRLQVRRSCSDSPGSARNQGLAAATGRYCLFLDDDIIADPGLVAAHIQVQDEHAGVAGLGHVLFAPSPRAGGLARSLARRWNDRYSRVQQGEAPTPADCWCGNLSVPRAAALEVGGFADDLQDWYTVELGYRLERRGLSFVYVAEAIGRKEERRSFQEVAAAVERTGVASFRLYRRHPPLLAHTDLRQFGDARLGLLLLRRLLLAIHAPVHLLALLDPVLGSGSWADDWYRFLYSYCYWRGVRQAVADHDVWQRLTRSPVILMYHAVGGPDEPPGCYIIPRHRFAWQMAWLKWRRYRVLNLEEFLCDRREHRLPPGRSAIITFDDGYADNRTVAYPILRRHGFPATIFLVSGAVGGTNQWDSEGELAGRPLLSWRNIQEMQQGGMCVGAHTRRHVSLTTLSSNQVADEVEGSRAEIERALGRPVLTFAYPNGRYDAASQTAVERAGFLGACCSHPGVNEPVVPLYALRRVEIRGTDSPVHFALALWLGIPRLMTHLRRAWRNG